MHELLTAEELGRRLRIRPDTVRAWARRGVIPSIRATSKTLRFDPAEVIAALRQQEGGALEGALRQGPPREVSRG